MEFHTCTHYDETAEYQRLREPLKREVFFFFFSLEEQVWGFFPAFNFK